MPPTRPRPHPDWAGIRSPRHWPIGRGRREEWQPSPDTEEIRQHLLDIVRLPEVHADEGYHFHTRPAHIEALMQLLEWRDERLVPALEEIARHPEAERARADIEETIRTES